MILDITTYGTFNIDYWKAERFIVKYETDKEVAFYWNDGSIHSIARYQPADGVVLIDITDFVRTYPERNTLGFQAYGGIPRIVNVTIAGLINPAGVFIPAHGGDSFCAISAPSVMLAPVGSSQIIFEMWARHGQSYNFSTGRVKEKPGDAVQNYARTITLANTTERVELWHLNEFAYRAIDIQPLLCERNYACVEWVSFTGARRRHIFEYTKNTIATDGGFSLLNLNNEYDTIKGREDGMTLRLTGLDMYDLWYYADLVTSSEVKVSLDGTNWTQVEVTTKNVTIPDGEATDGKLEVTIKYKRYDAVSL